MTAMSTSILMDSTLLVYSDGDVSGHVKPLGSDAARMSRGTQRCSPTATTPSPLSIDTNDFDQQKAGHTKGERERAGQSFVRP